MKILTITSLYPDATRPRHGIFIETRVRKLVESGAAQVRVIAPCPWFPLPSGPYGVFARVPRREVRHGITVDHPRYVVVPKIGMSAGPLSMYLSLHGAIGRLIAEGCDFDVIDAHYFFPDGVAAVMAARHFAKPVLITARGSDLNVLPNYFLPRRMILWAARQADGLATVSAALRDRLAGLGAARERIAVLRNGVDLALFAPRDRGQCRARLGLDGIVILSVGNLVEVKRHDLVIDALTLMSEAQLLIVGEGPERAALVDKVHRQGVATRVHFLGNKTQDELAEYYSAADVLVLASRNEGSPNVLLEAMACGTPVVVSDIPGMDEIVQSAAVGRLFSSGDAMALVNSINSLLHERPDRQTIRRYAENFGWQATTDAQLSLFRMLIRERALGVVSPSLMR